MVRDLPIFVVVYVLCLLAFAHLHFIVSNTLHAGVEVSLVHASTKWMSGSRL